MSTCHGGSKLFARLFYFVLEPAVNLYYLLSFSAYTVPSLQPGYHYIGPTGGAQAGDLCVCNTITYSLMSACDGCQGSDWIAYDFHVVVLFSTAGAYVSAISWSDYSNNCTTTLPPGT